jgi:glycosyltransferase involved in cell wall biosynthesis
MRKKIVIVSGSLHQIPPTKNSPAVPRILNKYAEFLSDYFDVTVISMQKGVTERDNNAKSVKYIQVKEGVKYQVLLKALKFMPYGFKKSLFGKANEKFTSYWILAQKYLSREKPDYVLTTMHIDAIPFMYRACPTAKHFYFFRSSNLELENTEKVKRISKNMLSGVISLTNEAQDFINREILPGDHFITQVVPNFVDLDKFSLMIRDSNRKSARDLYGISENDFVLGYAGRIGSSKGLLKVIHVLLSLRNKQMNVKLLIAGDQKIDSTPDKGSEYAEIVQNLKQIQNDVIIRPGWIPNSEMPLFYSALDVSLLLSKEREGHSMFGMESMACGVPVIATKVGGNFEIVVDNVSGFLIPKNYGEVELETLLLRLICDKNLYSRLSLGAHLNITERFNFSSSSKKLLSVFMD